MTKVSAEVDEVIRYVVAATGRIPLAVERYNKDNGTHFTKDDFFVILTQDTGDLVDKLKVQAILNLFETMNETNLVLRERMHELKPHEISALYTSQATAFGNLTRDKIEESAQAPVDNVTARSKFIDKLNNYKSRKTNADDEAVS